MTCVGVLLLVFAVHSSVVTFVYRSEADRVVVAFGMMVLWVGGFTCLVLGILRDLRDKRVARMIPPGR